MNIAENRGQNNYYVYKLVAAQNTSPPSAGAPPPAGEAPGASRAKPAPSAPAVCARLGTFWAVRAATAARAGPKVAPMAPATCARTSASQVSGWKSTKFCHARGGYACSYAQYA